MSMTNLDVWPLNHNIDAFKPLGCAELEGDIPPPGLNGNYVRTRIKLFIYSGKMKWV
jgi:hypothetical protein